MHRGQCYMGAQYDFSGAGFVFLILQLPFVCLAVVLLTCALMRSATDSKLESSSDAGAAGIKQIGKGISVASSSSNPTLLGAVCEKPYKGSSSSLKTIPLNVPEDADLENDKDLEMATKACSEVDAARAEESS